MLTLRLLAAIAWSAVLWAAPLVLRLLAIAAAIVLLAYVVGVRWRP